MKDQIFERYRQLQRYVGWDDADADRAKALAPLIEPALPALIDDFYEEIERHPETRQVITGGAEQVARLKVTLVGWLRELLSGTYDEEYVVRRWRVGYRHVEIGLDQIYTNAAVSRLRSGLHRAVYDVGRLSLQELAMASQTLNRLLDLDLAIIEDAYKTASVLKLQRIERLAAIGQIAGGVAHEVRNPLNVIQTSVYYLLHARPLTPEKQAEHLARIAKQVALANDVVTSLSNFARLPTPLRAPVNLDKLVRDVLDSLRPPSSICVDVQIPPNLPAALVDASQLKIVVSNLVRNAFDAMSDQGGTLTIAAAATAERTALELAFVDTGPGIAADHLTQILEPFFTTKARGIGLGLAISCSILSRNQGSLNVESEPGRGSTFTLTLAAANAEDHTP